MTNAPDSISRPSDSPLLDPLLCGEDLAHNAARFNALAPLHCAGCADYHVRSAMHRYAFPPKAILDRPELIRLARETIVDAAADPDKTIEIVIPGCSDTAMLSTCAHAAVSLGSRVLDRCRFTVLDRCRTPLLVCAEFALRHGLDFRMEQADLDQAHKPCDADLIITHSVFRFVEHAKQSAVLRRLGSWLAPEGRLLFSSRLMPEDLAAEAAAEIRKRRMANEAAAAALAAGHLPVPGSPDDILARLSRSLRDGEGRPGEFHTLAEVRALIRQSGLVELSAQCRDWEIAIASGATIRRSRALAVIARAGGNG